MQIGTATAFRPQVFLGSNPRSPTKTPVQCGFESLLGHQFKDIVMKMVYENAEKSYWKERMTECLKELGMTFVDVPDSYTGKFVGSPTWLDNEVVMIASRAFFDDETSLYEAINHYKYIYMVYKSTDGKFVIRGCTKDRYIELIEHAVHFYRAKCDEYFMNGLKNS